VLAGRFQIESVAGQGGAGTIYKARDLRTGRRVAVKVMRGAGHIDHARFAREAKVLSQIEHPALVQYLEHGTASDGTPYLVMEWLEGEDLRTRLARESLTLAETVLLGRRVAKVLALLHSCGLVHRDIKPGNLLVVGGNPADVKLLDLGLVRTGIEDVSSLTHTGLAIGTPGYMAPEQARGQKDIGGRADLFSLGCVLYRCVAGKAPFEGAHLIEVMTKVLLDEPPDLATVCPSAPVRLTSLIHAMLRKDPEQRPASAAEVAAQL